MQSLKKAQSKSLVVAITFLSIIAIGLIDYYSSSEISFSIFYLIPIAYLSSKINTNKIDIIVFSFIAGLAWFISDYHTRVYSSLFFPVWNALVRFTIFISIGLLLYILRKKETKLIELNTKLTDLNTEKNKFIGIAAHDLTNPIGAIYSFSGLLIDSNKGEMNEEIEEGLEIIKELSTNSLSVLKNLLNVSVIESGKIDLKIAKHNYVAFIEKQIQFNQIIAKNKKISIKLHTTEENIPLDFDNHYLIQVINNLLSNAIKFSFENSEILVKISKTTNNTLLTEVIDQGKGIPESEQQKLFNYFQKTSTQPTKGEQSTGLGLAIAKQIITLHNGNIGVDTTLNKGSNFYYTLPF